MYDDVWDRQELLFKIKLLKDRVEAFESGEKYVRMEALHKIARQGDFRTINRLKKELSAERAEKRHVRELWYQTCLDLQNEFEKKLREKDKVCAEKLAEKDRIILLLQKDLQEERARREEEHGKYLKQVKEAYEAKTQLEEEKEKNQDLLSRIHKDYSNSSKSSSMSPNHKTIHNSREKTGLKPGGQPGHIHHGRKRHEPTESHEIPAPDQYLEDPDFQPTGHIVRKQMIKVHVTTEVIEYWTAEFRNVITGQRVHAEFPPGFVDDVNYDGTIKALAYIVNNDLYTSIDKTRVFLKEISEGKVDISTGFICNLSKQFSDCTKEERDQIFQELMSAPVVHSDFTFGRTGGRQSAVMITATDDGKVLYQGRAKKGDEGIKGSPVEHYRGTLVSDHEASLVKHGERHQECLAHIRRYAKSEAENEPEKTWGRKLDAWITDSVGYWHEVNNGFREYDKATAERYIDWLKEILATAKEEYEYEPPSKYYRDGYNTYKRMEESLEEYVLFLRDTAVPPTNNVAERCARRFKRKAHQVMSFRSQEGADRFCDGLSITESIKAQGGNLFNEVTERFNNRWLSRE